jgi:hypothetical protein
LKSSQCESPSSLFSATRRNAYDRSPRRGLGRWRLPRAPCYCRSRGCAGVATS